MKKAQGISMNVMVIAAIALLVLVILSLIFTGKINLFSANVIDCVSKGGSCNSSCQPNEIPLLKTSCNSDGIPNKDVCCLLGV